MKTLTFAAISLALPLASYAENWPSWRGEDNNGYSSINSLGTLSDTTDIAWKTELPGRGCSTPIVWNRTIVVTTEIGQQDGIVAIDWNGKQLWNTTVGELTPGRGQRVGSGANSSPVTDGETLFAYFKSGNLAALDFSGNVLWKTNLEERFGEDKLWWDKGSSPLLAGGYLVVPIMQTEGDSQLVAFDKKSGKIVWNTPRNYETAPESGDAYTSPQVLDIDGKETIVTWGANHLTGHDAYTGKLLWEVDGFNPGNEKWWRVIASTAISKGIAIVPYARGEAVAGVSLSSNPSGRPWLWEREGLGSDSTTPVAYDGKAVILKDNGIQRGRVTCLDLKTGNTLWESRLPKSAQKYYASPLIAGNTLIVAREDGMLLTADISKTGLGNVSEKALLEPVIASPIVVDGSLFIRGDQHLFCIRQSDS